VARHHFELGESEKGVERLEQYLQLYEPMNARYSGDYGLRRRQQQLQTVAKELARAGQLAAALKTLGESAEIIITEYAESSDSSTLAALARQLGELPPAERYALLKSWTLPSQGQNTVRLAAAFIPPDHR